jgi:hypothetical protein
LLQCRSSLIGTKRTSQQGFLMSAFGGKADIVRRRNHTFKISLRICEGSWRCQRTRSFGPRGGGRGLQGQNSAGSKQDEIGVRCCLQFNQSVFNHSICSMWLACRFPDFGLSRTPSRLARPLHEKVWQSRCGEFEIAGAPEPPGTGALFFTDSAIRARIRLGYYPASTVSVVVNTFGYIIHHDALARSPSIVLWCSRKLARHYGRLSNTKTRSNSPGQSADNKRLYYRNNRPEKSAAAQTKKSHSVVLARLGPLVISVKTDTHFCEGVCVRASRSVLGCTGQVPMSAIGGKADMGQN